MNYLIIDKNLNESLEHDDIVSKICAIKLWFEQRSMKLPQHVSLIMKHIEQMTEYEKLKNLKGQEYTREMVQTAYIDFVRSYFDPESDIQKKLQERFKGSFQNAS